MPLQALGRHAALAATPLNRGDTARASKAKPTPNTTANYHEYGNLCSSLWPNDHWPHSLRTIVLRRRGVCTPRREQECHPGGHDRRENKSSLN